MAASESYVDECDSRIFRAKTFCLMFDYRCYEAKCCPIECSKAMISVLDDHYKVNDENFLVLGIILWGYEELDGMTSGPILGILIDCSRSYS